MAKLWIVLILVIMPIVNRSEEDFSCHYATEGDALPSAEDANFSPLNDSIFFHDTGCWGMLNSRQACSVESAARAHPGRKIYVFFSGPITENILYHTRNSLSELNNIYSNINFIRVHINEYVKNTILEDLIVTKRTHHYSQWPFGHTSDMLRFITLHKFGGLYLDTDMIVLKPLYDLGSNWVARESGPQVGSAVIHAAKDDLGQKLMTKVLVEIATTYLPNYWYHNGPGALNRVLSVFCNTSKVEDFSKATCQGFEVYNPELIFPVHYLYFSDLLKTLGEVKNLENIYTVHLWNHNSFEMEVQPDSPFDKLAKQHCPVVYQLYGDCFGS